MAQSQVVFGYWAFRGLGQILRNLASYLNISFEDKQYSDSNAWHSVDKPNLRSDFPNLPYLVDGDKIITESEAIAVHLAFKANRSDLLGNTPEERIQVGQIRGVYSDVRKKFFEILFNKTLLDVQKEFNEKVLPKLTLLSKHLGTKDFFIGNLTVVDFFLAEILSWMRFQDGDWLASVPNLKDYVDRAYALPGLKEYFESGRVPSVFMSPSYINEKIKT